MVTAEANEPQAVGDVTMPGRGQLARLPQVDDCRMGQGNPARGYHFHQISKTGLEPQIPKDAEDDDLPIDPATGSGWAALKRSSLLSIRIRFLQRRVYSDYDLLLTFSPKSARP